MNEVIQLPDKNWRGDDIPTQVQDDVGHHDILMTSNGDTLLALGSGFKADQALPGTNTAIGQHKYCGGLVRYTRIGPDKACVHCSYCGLRQVVAHGLTTYGDLAGWLHATVMGEIFNRNRPG
jgi:hypothetical protein